MFGCFGRDIGPLSFRWAEELEKGGRKRQRQERRGRDAKDRNQAKLTDRGKLADRQREEPRDGREASQRDWKRDVVKSPGGRPARRFDLSRVATQGFVVVLDHMNRIGETHGEQQDRNDRSDQVDRYIGPSHQT